MASAEILPLLRGELPYCKGCGHGQAARALSQALEATGLPTEQLCLVSDIGCVGLIDALLPTLHTVHTTHGRSTAFAQGLHMADAVLHGGRTKVIVVIGDGGATIGLLHLVAAAQANVDITVVLHNNHLYGMTGGQGSGMTPADWITTTTRGGNPFPPLDMMGILRASGATHLGRYVATDPRLPEHLRAAIEHPGFACVEVLELCTAFGVKFNAMNARKLKDLAELTGQPLGELATPARPSFAEAWRQHAPAPAPPRPFQPIAPTGTAALDRPLRLVVAGTAGEGVQTAASLLAQAAVGQGLFATRKNDNLVTQGSGYSLSEVVLSPEVVHFTGIGVPDLVIATSQDGLKRTAKAVAAMGAGGLVIVDEGLDGLPGTAARVLRLPLRKLAGARSAALAGLALALKETGAFAPAHLLAQARTSLGEGGAAAVSAVEAWVGA